MHIFYNKILKKKLDFSKIRCHSYFETNRVRLQCVKAEESWSLFSWRNFLGSATVALFVLFGNLCQIMD
jgi:hypothetical protein